MIAKLTALVAALLATAIGCFFYGRHVANLGHEKDRAAWQADYDAQKAETARIQKAWDTDKEQEDGWKAKAEAAGNDAAAIARRLRLVSATRAGQCTVPPASAPPGEPRPSSPEPDELGGLEEGHFRNCALDAADYDTLTAWYKRLRAAQKPVTTIDGEPIVTPDIRSPRNPDPWDGMGEKHAASSLAGSP